MQQFVGQYVTNWNAVLASLTLAIIPVLVLDDHEGIGMGSRAICFAKRCLEVADRYGCGEPMLAGERGFGCSAWRDGCRFVVWKQIDGKAITPAIVRTLVDKGKTRLLKGFDGDTRGRLILENGEVRVEREGSA